MRYIGFVLLCFSLVLVAYAQLPSEVLAVSFPTQSVQPEIMDFRASAASVTPGTPVTLSWTLKGAERSSVQLFPESGARAITERAPREATHHQTTRHQVTRYPALSTSYTLLLHNALGSVQRDARVEVQQVAIQNPAQTGGANGNETDEGTSEEGDSAPSGTFGVSANETGPFFSDRAGGVTEPSDERIVRVAPGGEFFAQASFRDPDGITEVVLNLVNRAPEGLSGPLTPTRGPFTLTGEPEGTCNLTALPTEVRCVYRVEVAEDAQNITELPGAGDEFAYVFRVRAIDALGNSANRAIRGYVVVEEP